MVYRLAGLLCLLENAMIIAEKYLLEYGHFDHGKPTKIMFDRVSSIVETTFGAIFEKDSTRHLIVDDSIARRAIDVALATLEQYKLLLFVEKDDGRNWNIFQGGPLKWFSAKPSADGQTIVSANLEKPNRRLINLLKKSNPLKVNVLLHDSIVFIKSALYTDWKLKMASAVVDKNLLPELVQEGLLIAVDKGILSKWNKPTVYIKVVPGGGVSHETMDRMLAAYGDERLNMETYLTTCKKINLEGSGQVSPTVFEIINRSEYSALKLDISPLLNLKPSECLAALEFRNVSYPEGGKIAIKQVQGKSYFDSH